MEAKKFIKKIENFVCENCGAEVKGSGYTNHCPKCLWSKHVDINPGDRAEECGGLMMPIGIEKEGQDFFITHKCEKCGFERRKRTEKEDDFSAIIETVKKAI